MNKSIYIAGSSQEQARALEAMQWVHEQPGFTLTHDWVEDIRQERIIGGRQDGELSHSEQQKYASQNLQAISNSHIMWLLTPETPSAGAWTEYGYGLLMRNMRVSLQATPLVVVCSGERTYDALFTSLADQRFQTDNDARAWLSLLP